MFGCADYKLFRLYFIQCDNYVGLHLSCGYPSIQNWAVISSPPLCVYFPLVALLSLSVLTQLPPVAAAAIEACLGHLLKRRAAGFLRSDKIAALFTKVGKVCDTAGEVCHKVQEQLQQQADLTRLVTQMSPTPPVAMLLLSAVLNSPKSVPRQPWGIAY